MASRTTDLSNHEDPGDTYHGAAPTLGQNTLGPPTVQPNLGVEDAIIYLFNGVYVHLNKPASTVSVMFFDLSSAFNTIRPTLFGQKLSAMQVDSPLVTWIIDYLIGRPQYVCLQHCVSDRLVNTRTPQGTVLSPFLFTLYCTETCHLRKFSDDSAKVGCISEGVDEYRTMWTTSSHCVL